MRSDKYQAIALRKSGKSYNEISEKLGIAKGTLTGRFKDEKWSKEVKNRLMKIARDNARKRMTKISHAARKEKEVLYKEKRRLARDDFQQFRTDRLFTACLIIYWGEGDSNAKNCAIRVTNTDPHMLKLFKIFLKKYLTDVFAKSRAYLILYPDLNDDVCKKFWSRSVGISVDKFTKSQYIKGSHPTRRLSYGVCTITATNRAQKEALLEWINLIRKEIKQMRV